jgi:hypothetical protein
MKPKKRLKIGLRRWTRMHNSLKRQRYNSLRRQRYNSLMRQSYSSLRSSSPSSHRNKNKKGNHRMSMRTKAIGKVAVRRNHIVNLRRAKARTGRVSRMTKKKRLKRRRRKR